jgi:acyl dehydratase
VVRDRIGLIEYKATTNGEVNMPGAMKFTDAEDVARHVGKEIYASEWMTIGQDRIDQFAQATGDFQWIHVDPARAKSSPYGGTIAHGFLTLSLLGKFYEDFMPESFPFCDIGLNYGLNKVRFTNPVRAASRVRGRFLLSKLEDVDSGLQMTFTVTVEIEGSERPALVAESIVRRYIRTVGARAA